MSGKSKLLEFAETILNEGPGCVTIVLALTLLFSILGLALVDPIIGAASMSSLTGNTLAGWLVSLATTAIIMVPFAVVTYLITKQFKLSVMGWVGVVLILLIALTAAIYDVKYDGLSLDIYKYGKFINPEIEISDEATRQAHNEGRWILRLLSTVGDASAGFLLGMFPLLNDLLKTVLQSVKPNNDTAPTNAKHEDKPANAPTDTKADGSDKKKYKAYTKDPNGTAKQGFLYFPGRGWVLPASIPADVAYDTVDGSAPSPTPAPKPAPKTPAN